MKQHTLDPESWNLAHRTYLIQFALPRVSDFGTAEDLVQDVFLSAWNARSRFRGDCTERTWLTGILRNKIIDLYRRNGRRPSVLTTDLDASARDDNGSFSWIDQQPDRRSANQPEAETERHEFLEELETAVTALPDKMGQAFRMREIEGFSTAEITDELNISKSNLWVLIHRAKQSLNEQLSPNWDGVDEFGGQRAA